MKRILAALLVVVGALVLATPASAQAPAGGKSLPSGAVISDVKVTATVVSVDVAKRLLTLKGPDGKVETYEVDQAMKNLPQLKKGDVIVAVYHESLAYEVRKAGAATPGVEATAGAVAAKSGEKPGAAVGGQVTATVTITAINAKAPSVTVKGPAGNVRTIKIKDPKNIEGVAVGDTVDITYTEALVISAQKPAKK